MPPLTRSNWEAFCQYYVCGEDGRPVTATKAMILAGYSAKTCRFNVPKMMGKKAIKERIAELQEQAAKGRVMSLQQIMERLSEIAQANLTDFMELGKDGSWVNLGPETPRTAAIQEIHSRTEYDENGDKPTVHTSVKLHDPMKAMDMLAKLRGFYPKGEQAKVEVTVNNAVQVKLDAETLKSVATSLGNVGAVRLGAIDIPNNKAQ